MNGLKVIVKRRPASPTVSAGMFVRGGVRNQTAQNAGIESLALSAATEGSQRFPRAVMRKELSRTGSTIGSGTNYDFGVISLSSTRPNFDRTWEIFTDVVLRPAFTQADFDLVKDRTLTGLRNRGVSPDDALSELESKHLFAGHPYAIDPNGSVETVQRISLADAKAYYSSLLSASRLLLIIVGDIDPQVFKKQVTASFGKLPRGNYSDPTLARLTFIQPTLNVMSRPLQTNYVRGVFAAPSLADPDYHAMRVAITILRTRVYQEVRERRNLSYAPSADMSTDAANTASIYVTATDANQAVNVMLNEIESMRRETMRPEQFEGISGYFLTTYYLQQETNSAQVAELARYEMNGGGWARSLEFLPKIQKVTPADVRSAAEKYMRNIRFFVVGDPNAISERIFTSRPQ